MKLNRPLLAFAVLTACYLAALLVSDARHDMFARLPALASIMPALMGMAFCHFSCAICAGITCCGVPDMGSHLAWAFAFTCPASLIPQRPAK
jgi:cytochrome c5